MTVQPDSLRERKKQRTRETIARVGLRLFAENGFQHTTIAQIADAADVSPRTVYTYFPVKEEIVFGLRGDIKQRLSESILNRPEGEDTMAALRRWLLSERAIWQGREEEMACQRMVISSDESLAAYERAQIGEFKDLLAEGLAGDLDLEPTDLEPRMAASAAVAVFDLLRTDAKASSESGLPTVEAQMAILDQALSFITGGVTAMREARED